MFQYVQCFQYQRRLRILRCSEHVALEIAVFHSQSVSISQLTCSMIGYNFISRCYFVWDVVHLNRKFEPLVTSVRITAKSHTLWLKELFLSRNRSMLRNVLRSLQRHLTLDTLYPYLHIHWTPICEIWNVLRSCIEMAPEIAKCFDWSLHSYTQLHAFVVGRRSEEFPECSVASAFRFIRLRLCFTSNLCYALCGICSCVQLKT